MGVWRSGLQSKMLTLDMGGTSTDVAVVIDSKVNTRRETRVGDVVVRVQDR